jgi:hypothetical protein
MLLFATGHGGYWPLVGLEAGEKPVEAGGHLAKLEPGDRDVDPAAETQGLGDPSDMHVRAATASGA